MRIAVILPSRGQIFSETLQEILESLEGYDHEIFWSHDNPIPACFNKPLEKALKGDFTHFWFVEEDMIIPSGTLKALLEADVDAIACDYPVAKDGQASITKDPDGNAFFTGTGCLLVKQELLNSFSKPIFRSDIAWDIREGGGLVELTPVKATKEVYGFHDITFGIRCYMIGSPIVISDITCGQRKLVKMGATATNEGQHTIEEWKTIKPFNLFSASKTAKRTTSVNVRLNDGTTALMPLERATELIAKGSAVASNLNYKYLDIVQNELTEEIL